MSIVPIANTVLGEKYCSDKQKKSQEKLITMKLFLPLIALTLLCALASAGPVNNGQYQPDNYYNGRYYKNRDFYNQRRYYDALLKQYKAGVAAKESRIVEQKVVPAVDGNFAYQFDTENGIHVDAQGSSVKVGTLDEGQKIEGSFAYITPEGLRVGVRYTADENGYHPVYTYDGIDAVRYANALPPSDVEITKIN
ncbi:cuticle protein 2-like [Stomoxys calcitrans]|uniref:cuticle protein 2-like n=1 Tax=Stomoxys calcitrans TaxID=35570 RepID=UPI0027E2A9E1|nr:cuticle protein 2-like [Stomoxys calcitrans]